jgi:hypothetical protein
MAYAREHLTWDGKAQVMTDILLWATKRGAKPKLLPPERLDPADRSGNRTREQVRETSL